VLYGSPHGPQAMAVSQRRTLGTPPPPKPVEPAVSVLSRVQVDAMEVKLLHDLLDRRTVATAGTVLPTRGHEHSEERRWRSGHSSSSCVLLRVSPSGPCPRRSPTMRTQRSQRWTHSCDSVFGSRVPALQSSSGPRRCLRRAAP